MVAYLTTIRNDSPEVIESLKDYSDWQDFMAQRFIDDEGFQIYVSEKMHGHREEEHYAFLSAMTKADYKNSRERPPARTKYQTKNNLEKAGKLLVYHKLDQAIQKHLDEARRSEWDNYMRFKAVRVITKREVEKLITAGVELPQHG